MREQTIRIPTEKELEDTYTKTFNMQSTGSDGHTVRVSIPREVVKKEAKKHKMSVKEFTENFRFEWQYDSFPGVHGTFVPIKKEEKEE